MNATFLVVTPISKCHMPRYFFLSTLILISLFICPAEASGKIFEQVIYPFSDCTGTAAPLIMGANGHLFGTARDGGAYKNGCAFELSPNPDGSWSETTLYNFSDGDPTGGLLFDQSGNLYGTAGGGTYGRGVVYQLSPSPQGEWTETVLHNFGNGEDGMGPLGELIFDNAGNLYGVTGLGGKHRGGTVFKLTPGPNGWAETILYNFWARIGGPGGYPPIGGVVMDSAGNLYGVTEFGGTYGYGAVYELSPKNGGYVERLIHSFNGYDGMECSSGLAMDAMGNLYGTMSISFSGWGTVYQLSKAAARGKWNLSVLHTLNETDGADPVGPVFIDGGGNLYGAARTGGFQSQGTVFMLAPNLNGSWKRTVLHRFHYYNAHYKTGSDGQSPYAGIILSQGVVYGTTASGGVNDAGTVFSITF